MAKGPTGQYVTVSKVAGEVVRAFVPDRLPPSLPLTLAPPLRESLDRSLVALGRLDSVSALLPDAKLFL